VVVIHVWLLRIYGESIVPGAIVAVTAVRWSLGIRCCNDVDIAETWTLATWALLRCAFVPTQMS